MMNSEWQAADLLYRQVHPAHAPQGIPSSQAFHPTPKDEGKLSVDDSRRVTAEQSWTHFTRNLGFQSAGTWAVSFGEVETPSGLAVLADPLDDAEMPDRSNPAHCLIDFNGLATKGERKRRAQQLAIHAAARGIQHCPGV
jgi:hypothetical protein